MQIKRIEDSVEKSNNKIKINLLRLYYICLSFSFR